MKRPNIFSLLSIGLLIQLSLVTFSRADQVTMKNGDRITGEIQRIWDMELIIEPEYDDDVNVTIDLENIAHIESEREFEVELTDGRETIAMLVGPSDDGQQLILIDGVTEPVALADIYDLDEIDDYFDWESHIDFNAAINKGNTDSVNTKFYADTNLKLGDHRHIADLTLTKEEQDHVTTKDQDLFHYNYNWLFDDPWFFGALLTAERDPIKDLDLRLILAALIGRDFLNTPDTILSGQLGVGYLTEEDTMGMTQQSAVAIWTLRYRQDLFNDDLEIFHDDSINVYLSGRRNTVIQTSTGVRYEITDLLYANVSLDYDYESDPAGAAENDDLSLVVGMGVEF
jgi:putative salt-induced outer membrane protein YdiY